MDEKKLVILDSNSLLNRAFYALPSMTNSKGQPTGAVYGFTMMLLKIMDDVKPDYIAAAFDKSKITFRTREYAEYKAGRKKMPDELAQQFEPVKRILEAFNIGIFEIMDYEADDIIGTISKKYESKNLNVIIYTGDRDALQLVSDYTKVIFTRKGITDTEIYDKDKIMEKYGLRPSGIIELKGLMGDSSDNIPGVKGVGEKTALKLLHEFETIEKIYENLDNISGKKLKENLEEFKEDAFLSRKLATINREVPINIDLDKIKTDGFDSGMVLELFREFEFKSLMNRVKTDIKEKNNILDIEDIKIYNSDNNVIEKIKEKKIFNFIFVFENKEFKGMIIENNYLVMPDDMDKFSDIFSSEEIVKNTLSGKLVYNYLLLNGYSISKIDFDFEIASYLLNPSESKYEIGDMMSRYANINLPSDTIPNENILSLFVNNMDKIRTEMFNKIVSAGMENLFYNVEMPLVRVLSSMELLGFRVDKEALHNIGFKLSEEIDKLTSEIYDLSGEEFNINSPKQLGVILFEKLGLPVIKKTKTGYSTDADVLDELSQRHEIVEKILAYRQLVKLKSTYIDGLISAIDKDDKIHSSFNQTVTATGRISSTEPNLQNIPIRMEQGRQIRKAFVPTSDEYLILSADYSQIELRVLAHMSKDKNLIEAFIKKQDIHTRTASEVFEIPMDEVTPLQRSRAKAVNFGIVYGLSDFGLSKDIKITRKEARRYIDNYFERYTGVKNYLDEVVEEGKVNGYVKTLMNRVRYIPEIKSKNRNVRMFGERLAMNTPIQGTAADIIKIAMVKVYNRLKDEKLKSKMILQVHDELILEAHKDELEYIKVLVKQEMEGCVSLEVPLVVDINIGDNWYEAK